MRLLQIEISMNVIQRSSLQMKNAAAGPCEYSQVLDQEVQQGFTLLPDQAQISILGMRSHHEIEEAKICISKTKAPKVKDPQHGLGPIRQPLQSGLYHEGAQPLAAVKGPLPCVTQQA